MRTETDATLAEYVRTAQDMPRKHLAALTDACDRYSRHPDDTAAATVRAVIGAGRIARREGTEDAPAWWAFNPAALARQALRFAALARQGDEGREASVEDLWSRLGDEWEALATGEREARTDPAQGGRLPLAEVWDALPEVAQNVLTATVHAHGHTAAGASIATGTAGVARLAFRCPPFAAELGAPEPTTAVARATLRGMAAAAYGVAMAAREETEDGEERAARYLRHISPRPVTRKRLPKGVKRPDNRATEPTSHGRIRVEYMPANQSETRGMVANVMGTGGGRTVGYATVTYSLTDAMRPGSDRKDVGDDTRSLRVTDASRARAASRRVESNDRAALARTLEGLCRRTGTVDGVTVCRCGGASGKPLEAWSYDTDTRTVSVWLHPVPVCASPVLFTEDGIPSARCGCGAKRGALIGMGTVGWSHRVRSRAARTDAH